MLFAGSLIRLSHAQQQLRLVSASRLNTFRLELLRSGSAGYTAAG